MRVEGVEHPLDGLGGSGDVDGDAELLGVVRRAGPDRGHDRRRRQRADLTAQLAPHAQRGEQHGVDLARRERTTHIGLEVDADGAVRDADVDVVSAQFELVADGRRGEVRAQHERPARACRGIGRAPLRDESARGCRAGRHEAHGQSRLGRGTRRRHTDRRDDGPVRHLDAREDELLDAGGARDEEPRVGAVADAREGGIPRRDIERREGRDERRHDGLGTARREGRAHARTPLAAARDEDAATRERHSASPARSASSAAPPAINSSTTDAACARRLSAAVASAGGTDRSTRTDAPPSGR